ncbi:MAG TPA: hypothetical protein VEZ49_03935 [Gemmatimonadales bacterium]|nr:hypothetical protein [Gemmatimonadales bacterium]
MRDLLSRVRRTPERLLHSLRRRKALDALRSRPRPRTVLAVCHGNICRSPVAAALLSRELTALGVDVESAGFIGPNRPPPPAAIAAAARHGVDLSEHRSRLLTADLVRAADLIIVMDPAQQRVVCDRFGLRPRDVIVLGDVDPAPVEARTIRDPVNECVAVFEQTYERIARCVRELTSVLEQADG